MGDLEMRLDEAMKACREAMYAATAEGRPEASRAISEALEDLYDAVKAAGGD
jgi:hypothetical protein